MPFRHLLFARNGGAPKRNPAQVVPTLDEQRFFDPDNETSLYNRLQWPEGQAGYQMQQSPMDYSVPMTHDQHLKQQNPDFGHPFDQSNMYPASNAIPYQSYPYDWSSASLIYSSESTMDTDRSSTSRDSILSSSSGAHADVMYETDSNSLHSISRKGSVISDHNPDTAAVQLCPAILSGGKCNPSACGPNAPCLQYLNNDNVPPIEDCMPDSNYELDSNSQSIGFTTPHTSPQRRSGFQHAGQRQLPSGFDDSISRGQAQCPAPKTSRTGKEDGTSLKQTKKTRARQAHSLVERKYREGLNNRINQLFELLQQARASRSGLPPQTSGVQDEDADTDDDTQSRTSSLKVKKSDVLIEAMNYVHATQRELKQKDEQIQQLQERIKMMENWIRGGSSSQSQNQSQNQNQNQRYFK